MISLFIDTILNALHQKSSLQSNSKTIVNLGSKQAISMDKADKIGVSTNSAIHR